MTGEVSLQESPVSQGVWDGRRKGTESQEFSKQAENLSIHQEVKGIERKAQPTGRSCL